MSVGNWPSLIRGKLTSTSNLNSKWQRGIAGTEVMVIASIVGVLSVVGGIIATQKFLSAGQDQAGGADLHNIQTAVIMLMADNDLQSIPSPVTTPTRDMNAFPDATTPRPPGLPGYRLYGHDLDIGWRTRRRLRQ